MLTSRRDLGFLYLGFLWDFWGQGLTKCAPYAMQAKLTRLGGIYKH
jgi:hypothetical protein